MSQRAVARLAKKLDEVAKTGATIEIGEEMRHLTLQVLSDILYTLRCTLLYCTLLYCTLLYSTLFRSTLLCSALLYSTLLYSAVC